MNLIDYDGLITYFTYLSQRCLKKSDGQEGRYNDYLFGKAAAYLEVVNILTKLKNGGAPYEKVCKDNREEL